MKFFLMPILMTLMLLLSLPVLSAEVQETIEIAPVSEPNSQVVGLDLQYSSAGAPNLEVSPDHKLSKRAHSFRVALEALLLKSYGKLALGLAGGYWRVPNLAVGNEKWASVYAVPIETNLTYRFDYSPSQWLAPFIQAGAKGVWVGQTSKTGAAKNGLSHNYGFTYGGGLALNIGAIETSAAKRLKYGFGIHAVYLVVSYHRTEIISGRNNPDISGDNFSAGLRLEL